MHARIIVPLAVSLVLVSAAGAVPAGPVQAGVTLTLEAPETFTGGDAFDVSGRLTAAVALPVIVEVGAGLPGRQVDVLVDGVVATTVVTDADGAWQASITLPAPPPFSHEIQAVAFGGDPHETRSPAVRVRSATRLITLDVEPSSASIASGAALQLTARASDENGRAHVVTQAVAWMSSDDAVVTVSASGLVTGVASGVATVTASIQDQVATATITVT